jgi:DNA-binding LacI/PurR family transcriptional regulator
MEHRITKPTRRRLSYGQLAGHIRSRIVAGGWVPGERLPTRRAWVREFGTNPKTMQQAIDCLASDGFVEARGRAGTFVSPRPPHLTDYAIVFHGTPDYPYSWGRFWQVLSASAKSLQQTGDRRFPQFYGIYGRTDSEDYQNLLRRLRSQQLAGLIFASSPHALINDPILEEPGIPRVALSSHDPRLGIPTVTVDSPAFCARAVDYLVDRGRKRIAALFYAGDDEGHDLEDQFLASLQKRGCEQRPYWRQYVNVFHPRTICRVIHLLLNTDQTQRPDALVVTDDTMVDAVVNGLFAAGVNVPRDVEVIAHANFPVAPTAMPIKRLGYDSRPLLQTCIRLIDQQRRCEPVPSSTLMHPLFADEIEGTVVN